MNEHVVLVQMKTWLVSQSALVSSASGTGAVGRDLYNMQNYS
jgi:hypothetical protein